LRIGGGDRVHVDSDIRAETNRFAGLAAGELWYAISPAAPFWIAAAVMAAALAAFLLAPVLAMKRS